MACSRCCTEKCISLHFPPTDRWPQHKSVIILNYCQLTKYGRDGDQEHLDPACFHVEGAPLNEMLNKPARAERLCGRICGAITLEHATTNRVSYIKLTLTINTQSTDTYERMALIRGHCGDEALILWHPQASRSSPRTARVLIAESHNK